MNGGSEMVFCREWRGRWERGVAVLRRRMRERPAGLTVNAFCSVSLNPPLILICVDLASATRPVISESGVFAVNMLADNQEYLSRCFATSSAERYEGFCRAGYRVAATGAPIIDDTLAFIDTRVVAEYPGGDHVIFLGQAVAMGAPGRAVFASGAQRKNTSLLQHGSNGTWR